MPPGKCSRPDEHLVAIAVLSSRGEHFCYYRRFLVIEHPVKFRVVDSRRANIAKGKRTEQERFCEFRQGGLGGGAVFYFFVPRHQRHHTLRSDREVGSIFSKGRFETLGKRSLHDRLILWEHEEPFLLGGKALGRNRKTGAGNEPKS